MVIKVGDLVTPSFLVKQQSWWYNCNYLNSAELLVIAVAKAYTFTGYVIYFHDPIKGTRAWRSQFLELVDNITLENE